VEYWRHDAAMRVNVSGAAYGTKRNEKLRTVFGVGAECSPYGPVYLRNSYVNSQDQAHAQVGAGLARLKDADADCPQAPYSPGSGG
jgi:hypothetical protein